MDSRPRPPVPFEKFMSSELFCLRVGPSRKCFYLHKELIAELSQELHAHVYNDMKEGQEGAMDQEMITEDTVTRFCEWAYTGDYNYSAIIEVEEVGNKSPWVSGFSSSADASIYSSEPADRTQIESDESVLSHARLYVFGDMYNIPSLKTLAFEKLIKVVDSFGDLNEDRRCKSMIRLIAYCFANLPERTDPDKALIWLGKYAAQMLRKLRKIPEFFDVLEEEIDFAKALFAYVRPAKGKGDKNDQTRSVQCACFCSSCGRSSKYCDYCGSSNYKRMDGNVSHDEEEDVVWHRSKKRA